jgi:hypothetical protein
MQYYYDFYDDEKSFLAFYPQVHVELLPFFEVQAGMGFVFEKSKTYTQLVHRSILSTPESVE